MKYLTQVKEDGIQYICAVIPEKEVQRYLKAYPKGFAKIRPGFRPDSIKHDDMIKLLVDNHNKPFIGIFIEKCISEWMSQIEEYFSTCISNGDSIERAYLHTLPHSFFADNVGLYFMLTQKEVSKEYISLLNTGVQIIKELNHDVENEKYQLNEREKYFDRERKMFHSKINFKEAEIKKLSGKLVEKTNECKNLSSEVNKITALYDTISKDEICSLKCQNRDLIKEVRKLTEDVKKNQQENFSLKKQFHIKFEQEQKYIKDIQTGVPNIKEPSDILEFKEYLEYNLKNFNIKNSEEYWELFTGYLCNILFQGLPILVNYKASINLARCVSNTLIGQKQVEVLVYSPNVTSFDIKKFLFLSRRVVCLDGFVGNFNEMELIPILECFKGKIIFLSVTYERTLQYFPKDFIMYCNYLNTSRIGELSINIDITEDPSIISESVTSKKAFEVQPRYQKICRDILQECGFSQNIVEHFCAKIESETDLCQILAFTVLPYCMDVRCVSPYSQSNRLQKYAGKSGRCPNKNLLLRWFGQ